MQSFYNLSVDGRAYRYLDCSGTEQHVQECNTDTYTSNCWAQRYYIQLQCNGNL